MPPGAIRKSFATRAVVRFLLENPAAETYPYEVAQEIESTSGVVVPILNRLEQRGMLTSRREDPGEAARQGRPARRYYRLTDVGLQFFQSPEWTMVL